MKLSTLFLLLTVSLVMLPHTSQGQGIASPAFALFRPAPTPPTARPASFNGRAPDYRWEGIVIGGVIGAVCLGTVVYGFCSDEGSGGDCFFPTLAAAPIGFVVGGSVGALVGILIPKGHSP